MTFFSVRNHPLDAAYFVSALLVYISSVVVPPLAKLFSLPYCMVCSKHGRQLMLFNPQERMKE